MTEQTPQDETREKQKHEPRDAAHWARYVETLKAPDGIVNPNVEGRRVVGRGRRHLAGEVPGDLRVRGRFSLAFGRPRSRRRRAVGRRHHWRDGTLFR